MALSRCMLFQHRNNKSNDARRRQTAYLMHNARNQCANPKIGPHIKNTGTLGNFVLALSVAALSIPRDVAFQAFLGAISGGVTSKFIGGIDSGLYVSLALLVVAGVLSFLRGKQEWTGAS